MQVGGRSFCITESVTESNRSSESNRKTTKTAHVNCFSSNKTLRQSTQRKTSEELLDTFQFKNCDAHRYSEKNLKSFEFKESLKGHAIGELFKLNQSTKQIR